MSVIIGSARSSFGNTSAGDQHNGEEVSTQSWYLHSKGWRVFRAKDPAKRAMLAEGMKKACANNDIGYSQGTRNTLTDNVKPYAYDPSKTTKKVNTDCSALARCCCLFAGIPVKDFITSSEPSALLNTGAFTELKSDKYTKKSDYLCAGDILVTKTKGHTVIVLTSGPKCEDTAEIPTYVYGDRDMSNGMEGDDVKTMQTYLIQLGYSCGDWGADGEFGDCTEMAVKQLQSDNSLAVTGIANGLTLMKIDELLKAEKTSTVGSVEIVNGNCYIRKEPKVGTEIIAIARKGSTYIYANETSEEGWLKILYNNTEGWVSGKYAKLV